MGLPPGEGALLMDHGCDALCVLTLCFHVVDLLVSVVVQMSFVVVLRHAYIYGRVPLVRWPGSRVSGGQAVGNPDGQPEQPV